MRKTMILLSLALVSWGAFAQHDHSKMNHSTDGHSTMDSKMTNKSMVQSSVKVERSRSASAIIDNYLALKDALIQDDSKNAASSGKKLFDAFSKFDLSAQAKQQQKELAKSYRISAIGGPGGFAIFSHRVQQKHIRTIN